MRALVRKILASAVLAIATVPALAGVREDAPPRVDAFMGIMSRQELLPGDPQVLVNPKVMRAAMLLSENTKKHLAWCEAQTAGRTGIDRALGRFFGGEETIAGSDRMHLLAYDPKFVTDRVATPLVQRFASLKLVENVAQFRQGGFDIMVLVDVSFVNTVFDSIVFIGSKYETGAFINLYFIDPMGQLSGKVEVGELKDVERSTFLLSVAKQRQMVMDQYEAALNTTLGPVPRLVEAISPSAAPVMSTSERLKALDELLKQGLLTPAEAAAKRAQILNSL